MMLTHPFILRGVFFYFLMRISIIILLLVSTIATFYVSCDNKTSDKDYAPIEYYYAQCLDSSVAPLSKELIRGIENYLERSMDYILTEESAAKGWPYYGEVMRDSKVERQIIMPPHSTVHRVAKFNDQSLPEENIKRLEITILYLDSRQADVKFKIYYGKPDEWKRIVDQPKHNFLIDGRDMKALAEEISKAAIRFTFK